MSKRQSPASSKHVIPEQKPQLNLENDLRPQAVGELLRWLQEWIIAMMKVTSQELELYQQAACWLQEGRRGLRQRQQPPACALSPAPGGVLPPLPLPQALPARHDATWHQPDPLLHAKALMILTLRAMKLQRSCFCQTACLTAKP